MLERQVVRLGPDEQVIDLARDRPGRGVELAEAVLDVPDGTGPPFHCIPCVHGNALVTLGGAQGGQLRVERHQLGPAGIGLPGQSGRGR